MAIKGPAAFLAQFLRDKPPVNNLKNIGKWFAGLGYKGIQIPGWDARVIEIDKAASLSDEEVMRSFSGMPFWDGSIKCMQSMVFVKSPGFPGQAWHQDEPTKEFQKTQKAAQ